VSTLQEEEIMKKARGKRLFWGCLLAFVGLVSCSAAWGDFYVIPVGMKAKRTVLVSPKSTPTESGTALLNALTGITGASESNPYLIIIEPGVYDIGGSTLQMDSYVAIQGSGENVTKITGNIDGDDVGVVKGADYAELRFLTVENTGGGTDVFAIYSDGASPTMTNLTAAAYGGTDNRGVSNTSSSSPTMTNVTAMAYGGTGINYGVFNDNSCSPAIRRSTIGGDTNSLYTTDTSTATVSQSTLLGGVGGDGTITCVACDDGNGSALGADCL
jgi:hypothetical protein